MSAIKILLNRKDPNAKQVHFPCQNAITSIDITPIIMRKTVFLLLTATLFLMACGIGNENDVIPDATDPVSDDAVTDDAVSVDFYTDPIELQFSQVVEAKKDRYVPLENEQWAKGQTYIEHILEEWEITESHLWKVGIIKNGEFDGQTLVLAKIACDGPCPASYIRYAVEEGSNKWTLLSKYSNTLTVDNTTIHADASSEISIPSLDVPQELEIYDSTKVVLEEEFGGTMMEIGDTSSYQELLDIKNTSFAHYYERVYASAKYETPNTQIYAESKDGILSEYIIVPAPFADTVLGTQTSSLHTLVRLNNADIEAEYTIFGGGCGGYTMMGASSPTSKEAKLITKIGTFEGEDAYMLSAVEDKPEDWNGSRDGSMLSALYSNYDSYVTRLNYAETPSEPMSLEDFADSGNIFFLKMDNGVYVLTFNNEYGPVAECGKPVIYLYPTESTVVNVQVGIDEFTKTEPTYQQDGWTVLANPNGLIKNLVDSLTYPYLFWEGQSDKTIMLDEGFTLEKDQIESTLPTILQNIGLNQKETSDFMEFWLPKLVAVNAPYVQFNFIDQKVFETIAPLTILPKPDTVLRVFMYYKGVNQQGADVPAYTPVIRNGFTAIEWGGTLY